MSDDEDDSMQANPEPPRPSSRKPRGDRAGRWVVEFREGTDPVPAIPAKTCRDCGAATSILHTLGEGLHRVVCGSCQGKFNRSRL